VSKTAQGAKTAFHEDQLVLSVREGCESGGFASVSQ